LVEGITVAIIGLTITGIALGVAIFFNTLAIRDGSKIRHYDIMRNFEEKFHEIQDIDLQKDPRTYPIKLVNWCTFMEEMNKEKIIPIKFLKSYDNVFGEARWIASNILSMKKDNPYQHYIDWCKKHGFVEVKMSSEVLEALDSKLGVPSLKISGTSSSNAQLYWCEKCKKFFRTSKELTKHNDEKHGNENKK